MAGPRFATAEQGARGSAVLGHASALTQVWDSLQPWDVHQPCSRPSCAVSTIEVPDARDRKPAHSHTLKVLPTCGRDA